LVLQLTAFAEKNKNNCKTLNEFHVFYCKQIHYKHELVIDIFPFFKFMLKARSQLGHLHKISLVSITGFYQQFLFLA